MFTKTGITSTNHDGAEISVRVDETWKEIGVLAGEKAAIYIPMRKLEDLIKALVDAKARAIAKAVTGVDPGVNA
jgi:hypothetical protein